MPKPKSSAPKPQATPQVETSKKVDGLRAGSEVYTSVTGAKRDARNVVKGRFDLMSPIALFRYGRLLARGGVKYGNPTPINPLEIHKVCSCDAHDAIQDFLITLKAYVGAATKESLNYVIKNLPRGRKRTPDPGLPSRKTGKGKKPPTSITGGLLKIGCPSVQPPVPGLEWGFLRKMLVDLLLRAEDGVLSAKTSLGCGAPTQTTITRQALLEGLFARAVTKALASSETRKKLSKGHSPTCDVHRLRWSSDGLVLINSRNWEKGLPLSHFLDSAGRHLSLLLMGDKKEDHAAAIVWNVGGYMHTETGIRFGMYPAELNDLGLSTYPQALIDAMLSGEDEEFPE